jgi:uncharacterized repeat protein (TIGR03803 family)
MHSSGTSNTKHLNISDIGARLGSTKQAATATFGALTLAVLSALLLIAARPAQAQTETVLYEFPGSIGDGFGPESPLTSDGRNLYGTTIDGGTFGAGTVFELSPNANGGWNETVLYSFTGGEDGGYPTFSDVIFDSLGNLYGTAYQDGQHGYGVVFELSRVGTSWTETVLYSFANGTDAAFPINGLIMDSAGNLYGTAYLGGAGNGAIFEVSPSAGDWKEQVIYVVSTSYAGLTLDAAGNIYGVTYQSSTIPATAFELSPNGEGGWNPTVIHTFAGAPKDGSAPEGTPVLDNAGNLYGTTTTGGAKNYGTVYELIPGKKGTWTEKILHSFTGGTADGNEPWAGIVSDTAGNLYGTTLAGGKSGFGTVYELVVPVGTGSYKEKVLWNFTGTDGKQAYGSLILDSAAHPYGTTLSGGSSGNGVAFEVNPSPAVTTTTLSSSPNPSSFAQVVMFTATVNSSLGAPPNGEIVSFEQGTTVLGTGVLSGGRATLSISTLAVGTKTIKASYGGDANFSSSTSAAVGQVIQKVATAVTLISSQNPSTFGQSVTLTATVAPEFGGTPTGTLVFKDGTTTLKSGTLSGGSASYATSKLSEGTHNITATYNGNADFTGGSTSLTQTVN